MPMTDEQFRELRKRARAQRRALDRLGDDAFIGTGQVAEIMGVVKTNVGRLRAQGKIPPPYQELPAGPIWIRLEVEVAAEEQRRENASKNGGES